jgi:hypothetical protein
MDLLNKKIEELNSALNNVTEAANNEVKSSVGDKHETSRAMMQLEQEKLSKQLKELLDQRSELERIDITRSSDYVTKGTLIQSDKGYLFLSIGLGKIVLDEKTVFVISPQSPLGMKLMGLRENDSTELQGMKYLILNLF